MRSTVAIGLCLLGVACRCDEPEVRVLHPFPERYGGVGIELEVAGGKPRIVRVIPGTAAAEAGLRPGDALLEVDGVPVEGWELADAVAALRGEAGTRVIVAIHRVAGPREVIPLRRGLLVRRGGLDAGFDARTYQPARGP